MIVRLEYLRIDPITESRKTSNFFWAFIVLLGSLGLLLVAICSYLGMDYLILYEKLYDFPFIPQGATMSFYGIVGLFISFYLGCLIFWDVGGGYDIYNKKEKVVSFLRWGFPGKDRCIIIKVPMKEIKSIRIITGVKEEGIFTRTFSYYSIVYMETIEQGFIPLTRIEDDLTPLEIAQKAGELALFLDVPLLY
uniref:photosystem I assembly protein Ycf4 n=1 Tax=Cratylia mollis TaxID=252530 RepID=UPI00220157CC|nr:photosystem I assembly protein Ycf4 [Cratylia mollis]UXL85222.1 photosystem I assembly protein Ycf4 [Cratylia mollis]